jgi:glycosyltransferase involved in cell wall biosynthesis
MIPVYNEEKTIENAVKSALKNVDRVLVINDGSTDNTTLFAENASAMVLNNDQNLGWAEVFKNGPLFAAEMPNVEVIINFDVDLQYDINDLPFLVSLIFSGEQDLMMGSCLAG